MLNLETGNYRNVSLELDSYQLKLIATVSMTLDHIGKYFYFALPNIGRILQVFGRIAAPLFLFVLVQGLQNTGSRRKYTARLYLAAVLMEAGNMLFSVIAVDPAGIIVQGNTFYTFFYVAVCISVIGEIYALMQRRKADILLLVAGMTILVIGLSPYIFINDVVTRIILCPPTDVEYAFMIPMGCVLYLTNSKKAACIIIAAASAVFLAKSVHSYYNINEVAEVIKSLFLRSNQWLMSLSIPFVGLYNKRKGKGRKLFFYLYYPLHQYVFCVLGMLLM